MTYSTSRARRLVRRAMQTGTPVLVAIASTGIIACGGGKDSATAPTTTNAVGTYVLQMIDQAILPTKIYDGPGSDNLTGVSYDQFAVTIKSGTLELDKNGHYYTSFDYNLVLDGKGPWIRALYAEGTYRITGTRIVLSSDNGIDKAEGRIENGQITMQMTLVDGEPTKAYVFRR